MIKSKSVFREEELNDAALLETLISNAIGRNQQLDTFMGLLNSINKNAVLTIDGGWGSGKTIFVRQLNFLSTLDSTDVSKLNLTSLETFQEKYTTYYFNAWENDFHEDPLQSILFNLINDLWGVRERTADSLTQISSGLLDSLIKTTSMGLIDTAHIRDAKNITQLVDSITTATERKKAVDDIINNYLDLKGKKLLFIIDELDRCKPTYAVKLLEVIKHYYTNDKIVFLMSTNNQQLAHTVKKVYGESFDGTGYLSKFYDLVFNLPKFKPSEYITYLGAKVNNGYWKDEVPLEVANTLSLSMREINRYYSSLGLIEHYLSNEDRFTIGNISAQLVKYVFIPFAYGLRIHNLDDYHSFVNGKGEDMLRLFCKSSNTAIRIINRSAASTDTARQEATDEMVLMYLKITTGLREDGDNYDIQESKNHFDRVVLLMNSSGVIDDDDGAIED